MEFSGKFVVIFSNFCYFYFPLKRVDSLKSRKVVALFGSWPHRPPDVASVACPGAICFTWPVTRVRVWRIYVSGSRTNVRTWRKVINGRQTRKVIRSWRKKMRSQSEEWRHHANNIVVAVVHFPNFFIGPDWF